MCHSGPPQPYEGHISELIVVRSLLWWGQVGAGSQHCSDAWPEYTFLSPGVSHLMIK